jgi:leucyl aminopeptidase
MEVKILQADIQSVEADAVIVTLFEGADASAHALDKSLNGALGDLTRSGDFRGKPNEAAVLYSRGGLGAPRVILVGLGDADELTLDRVREAAATGAKKARDLGCHSIAATAFGAERLDLSLAAQAVVEGAALGLYRWRANHTKPVERTDVDSLTMAEPDAGKVEAVRAGIRAGEAVASGVYRARDLVNQAPNILTPAGLASAAEAMAKEVGVKCTVRGLDWIKSQNMNAYLAVAQGSDNPPKFIELEYNGAEGAPLVFVGKGLTFDSGGISIKGADGMEDMRGDMGGAAAVIGAFEAIARLKLPLHIVGLIAATENLPGGHATRPADVVRARNGKTIEIVNTDAEGRLTLADALSYAADFHPQAVIDLATLTGACVVALGENVAAGYFANDDSLAQKVEAASKVSGEKMWRMPLYPDYRDKVRTDYADLKNVGGNKGGVGSSAVFLQEFTSYPWAHWDIAGMVLDKIGATSLYPHTHPPHVIRGGTGFGVRALVSLARAWKVER